VIPERGPGGSDLDEATADYDDGKPGKKAGCDEG
jgi:hypothetical protein